MLVYKIRQHLSDPSSTHILGDAYQIRKKRVLLQTRVLLTQLCSQVETSGLPIHEKLRRRAMPTKMTILTPCLRFKK